MNNYTFLELAEIAADVSIITPSPLSEYVKVGYAGLYGTDNFDEDVCQGLIMAVLDMGLWIENLTIISKKTDKKLIKTKMLTGLFVDALWEFQSKMKFNMYNEKLDDLNKKISLIKTSSESNSTNKFYENNNIKDAEGNWNSPQFLNRSENSENNSSGEGNSETTGELAKYLKDLQEVNSEIFALRKKIVMNVVSLLSYPFNDDGEYNDYIPKFWKYD